jgi:predicted nucleotidyltransferase
MVRVMTTPFVRYEDLTPRELRAKMLGFAGEFIARARVLPGVERIALLGSLLTPKDDPKDIDVLVTVTDDCDLAPLARLGRRLQGRAQSLNHGADVFLASTAGRYIGRTCHWRECRRGIRASCDAANCAVRPHLHDDLGTVALADELVREPPLEIYPEVVPRVDLAKDIAEWVAAGCAPAT